MTNFLKSIPIARVSTVAFFVFTQLRAQLEALADADATIYIVASNDDLGNNIQGIKNCIFNPLDIERQINFPRDLVALIKLWKFFRKKHIVIVHSTTPKAGLLCALAAKLAGTEVCIHTFTGQPWVTMGGIKKWLTRWSDKLIASLNTCCYTDSRSQRDFLIKNNICRGDKIKVLGSGSLAGVDLTRFTTARFSSQENNDLKRSLNIKDSTKVLLFVGRITREKGIFELLEAMGHLTHKHDVVLIIVGPFEQDNKQEIYDTAKRFCESQVRFVGFQEEPERYIAISDILCLPSYREGFGTVVIEAAAMGIPAVGTNIYGLSDAVVDKVTGLLIDPQNIIQLVNALDCMLSEDSLRLRMGEQAKIRVLKEFNSNYCSQLLIDEYIRLLNRNSEGK